MQSVQHVAALAPVDRPEVPFEPLHMGKIHTASCRAWLERDGTFKLQASFTLYGKSSQPTETITIVRQEPETFLDPNVFWGDVVFTPTQERIATTGLYAAPAQPLELLSAPAFKYVVLTADQPDVSGKQGKSWQVVTACLVAER